MNEIDANQESIKRVKMRRKLLEAAFNVFIRSSDQLPVIDDVVKEAQVSRGTFYNYFTTIDQLLIAVGENVMRQMVEDILPVHSVFSEPWQRVCIGYRLFMVRAYLDHDWATFVTRFEVWCPQSLIETYVSRDIQQGKEMGFFSIGSVEAATDFLVGASSRAIASLKNGVSDPKSYMDTQVKMILSSLGCDRSLSARGVEFSQKNLKLWVKKHSMEGPDWVKFFHTDLGAVLVVE